MTPPDYDDAEHDPASDDTPTRPGGAGGLIAVAAVLIITGCLVLTLTVVPVVFIMIFAGGAPAPTAATNPTGTTLPATVPGIPAQVLDAYEQAAANAPQGCGMRWQILAGIGETESGHAASRTISAAGLVYPPIYGPVLSNGTRAQGPMQFLQTSWTLFTTGRWAIPGHNGPPNPQNVYDAARAAANHLCSTAGTVDTPAGLKAAIYGYNPNISYLATVTAHIARYDTTAAPGTGADHGADGGSGSALGNAAVAKAKSALGTRYVFGGGWYTGPTRGGFDCSSYVSWAWYQATKGRIKIGRTTVQQIANTAGLKPVPLTQLKPGDLVYIHVAGDSQGGWNHVVMYIGAGKIAEEPRPPFGARTMPLAEYDHYPRTGRRVRT